VHAAQLLHVQPRTARWLSSVQHRLQLLEDLELILSAVALALGVLAHTLHALLHLRQVGQYQLQRDHLDVTQRIDRARHVDDVLVLEAAHDVHDGVALADVGEELVAQTLALGGARHQARNVHERQRGRHGLHRLVDVGEDLEPRVRHGDDARVGLDRAKGKVCGLRLRLLHERVEQRRFSHVG